MRSLATDREKAGTESTSERVGFPFSAVMGSRGVVASVSPRRPRGGSRVFPEGFREGFRWPESPGGAVRGWGAVREAQRRARPTRGPEIRRDRRLDVRLEVRGEDHAEIRGRSAAALGGATPASDEFDRRTPKGTTAVRLPDDAFDRAPERTFRRANGVSMQPASWRKVPFCDGVVVDTGRQSAGASADPWPTRACPGPAVRGSCIVARSSSGTP